MRVGIVAGEDSGDALGAGLIREVIARRPDARFEGVAGPRMLAAGCTPIASADRLAVMGLIEPLRRLPDLLKLRRELVQRWRASPPDVVVGIDSPDFNLGLETRLKRSGIATVHYVSPSIWAWRSGRIEKVRQAADLVLCILPFEKQLYDDAGIAARFVGHPKADTLPDGLDPAAMRMDLGIDNERVVTIMPGSRSSEVSRLGPIFAAAARRLREQRPDLGFVTPVASPGLRPLIEEQLSAAGIRECVMLLDGNSETAIAAADVVLLASGTAALEAALLGRPVVAAYRVAPLTAWLVRRFRLIKIARFTLPNLMTSDPQIPEFIQDAATPRALADAVGELLDDPARAAAITREFAKLRTELALGADRRAADALIQLTEKH